MRKLFVINNELDAQRIEDVKIDRRSRDQFPKILAALQYIFVTPELNSAIFKILEKHILGGKKATGRLGMSLWELFVMGVTRLNLDIDYDRLQDLVNNHASLRGILGIDSKQVFGEGKYYPMQTIKDNVCLLSEELLDEINQVVVKAGHTLKKNEGEDLELEIKTDSYAVEKNIHFPTDLNLLWDCCRKCMDIIILILGKINILPGWRKHRHNRKKLKKAYRRAANIYQKKGKDYKDRLAAATREYLDHSRELSSAVAKAIKTIESGGCLPDLKLLFLVDILKYYHEMLDKHIDLVERRIIKGEVIPHAEKVFSIFEPETEWLQKGKAGNKVELGHNVLISTDQYNFILDHKVMLKEVDVEQPIDLAGRLEERFSQGYILGSISFDRGFYSALSKMALEKVFKKVIMPKRGGKTAKQILEEEEKSFVALRHRHSAVESNINELEHSGVNRVPDKGMPAFKKYVAMGVTAHNLKILGGIVIEQDILATVVNMGRPLRKAA
jgi:hypothetical protein